MTPLFRGHIVSYLFSIIIFTIYLNPSFSLQISKEVEDSNKNICLTPECTITAGRILKWMDRKNTTNPCDNFYQFACGGYIEKTSIPADSTHYHPMVILREDLGRKLKKILESEQKNGDLWPLNYAKKYYSECLKEENENNLEKLVTVIEDRVKNIQVTNDEKTGLVQVSNLGKSLSQMRFEYDNYIAEVTVGLDDKNSENNIIFIGRTSLGLDRSYLVDKNEANNNRMAYKKYAESAWELIYGMERGNPILISEEIVEFESALANITTAPENRRDREKLYNPKNLIELKNLTSDFPSLDWEIYLDEILKNAFSRFSESDKLINFKLEDQLFIVDDLPYFESLGSVLNKFLHSNNNILVNYLRWRLIKDYGPETSSKMRDLKFVYEKQTLGKVRPEERWKVCQKKVNDEFGMVLSLPYAQNYFPIEKKNSLEKIVIKFREVFSENLGYIDWMDEKTINYAKLKAEKLKSFMAYPDWFDTDQLENKIDKYFKGLNISKIGDHFENYLEVESWKADKNIFELTMKKEKEKWLAHPTTVNAYYSSEYNSITFLAGILQEPYYGMPVNYLNYGAFGTVIGHEIIHGFDDQGRQTNADGNLVNWWGNETLVKFKERTECFKNQYGNLKDERLNISVNGINSLGENIADNGGINMAFRAYKIYVKENGEEQSLPGLQNYTPEQLFYISYAQSWCEVRTDEALINQIKAGVHAPPKYRVIGTMANSEGFASAFNCPLNENRCKIW